MVLSSPLDLPNWPAISLQLLQDRIICLNQRWSTKGLQRNQQKTFNLERMGSQVTVLGRTICLSFMNGYFMKWTKPSRLALWNNHCTFLGRRYFQLVSLDSIVRSWLQAIRDRAHHRKTPERLTALSDLHIFDSLVAKLLASYAQCLHDKETVRAILIPPRLKWQGFQTLRWIATIFWFERIVIGLLSVSKLKL